LPYAATGFGLGWGEMHPPHVVYFSDGHCEFIDPCESRSGTWLLRNAIFHEGESFDVQSVSRRAFSLSPIWPFWLSKNSSDDFFIDLWFDRNFRGSREKIRQSIFWASWLNQP
jgi:hypothetical protein